jgi:hypothetical protein
LKQHLTRRIVETVTNPTHLAVSMAASRDSFLMGHHSCYQRPVPKKAGVAPHPAKSDAADYDQNRWGKNFKARDREMTQCVPI